MYKAAHAMAEHGAGLDDCEEQYSAQLLIAAQRGVAGASGKSETLCCCAGHYELDSAQCHDHRVDRVVEP